MATVADIRLRLCEKKLGRSRFVDGMAAGAGDVVDGMNGSADVRPGQRLAMAAEAFFQGLLRRQNREGGDGSLAGGFDVNRTGAVTALAAGVFGRLVPGGDALKVRVLVKLRPDIGMAAFANVAAYERRLGRVVRRGGCERDRQEKQQAYRKASSHYTTIMDRLRVVC